MFFLKTHPYLRLEEIVFLLECVAFLSTMGAVLAVEPDRAGGGCLGAPNLEAERGRGRVDGVRTKQEDGAGGRGHHRVRALQKYSIYIQ